MALSPRGGDRLSQGLARRLGGKAPAMLMRTPTRWVEAKAPELPPGFIVPCQPILAAQGAGRRRLDPRVKARWLSRRRQQGRRARAPVEPNGRDWSSEFVAITAAMRALPYKRVMVDGEPLVHCLDGLPHFHKLVAGRPGERLPISLRPLWQDAQDLRGVELIGRRRMLQKALKKAEPALRFSEHMAVTRARRCSATPAHRA